MGGILKYICVLLTVSGSCAAWSQNLPVELRIQSGHSHQVNVVTFSPDGQLLASGGSDQNVIIWEVETGREIRRFVCTSTPLSIDFSRAGDKVLVNTRDGRVTVWNVVSGEKLKEAGGEALYLRGAMFMPDGIRFITGGGPGSALMWSLETKDYLSVFQGERLVCTENCQRALDISADGYFLLTTDRKGHVSLWDVDKNERIRSYKKYPENRHSSNVTAVAFLPDGKSFLAASEDEGILQWSLTNDTSPTILLEPQQVTSGLKFMLKDLTINQEGTTAAALFLEGIRGSFQRASEIGLHLFDLKSRERKSVAIRAPFSDLHSLDFHPVEDTLVIAHDATPQLYAVGADTAFYSFRGHLTKHRAPYWIMKVTPRHILLPTQNKVIERVGDGVYGWDIITGKVLTRYPPHDGLVLAMTIDADTTRLASGDQKGNIRVSDLRTGEISWEKELTDPVFALGFTPDDQHLISIHLGGRVIVWEAKTGDYVKDLPGGYREWYHTPFTIRFTGTGLATWGNFLMDTATAQRVVDFQGHDDRVHGIDISKDGKSMLTTGWDGKVILRELYYGGKVTVLEGHTDHVYAAILSPDEGLIASGGADNKIMLWDTESGRNVGVLDGHRSPVISLSFYREGRYLISGSLDGMVKVWDLRTQKEVYTHILLDEKRWMAKVPTGHFYATQDIMDHIFFVQGTTSYRLDQFFETFFEPRLSLDLIGTQQEDRVLLIDEIATRPPPAVEIAFPSSGNAGNDRIEMLLKITDEGGGISEIKVLQNGKRIVADRDIPKGNAIAKSYFIDLVPGANYLDATAYSDGRIESATARIRLNRPADQPTATAYVMAVGINTYKNPRLNLNYAVDDANSIMQLFRENGAELFTKVETLSILNEDATKTTIIRSLEEWSHIVKPTDVFYFFYAGHGSLVNEQFYFIPHNVTRLYEETVLTEEALHVSELVGLFKEIKALKQVVMIDACHSGGSTSVLASRGAAEEKALAQLSRSAGVHILAAAGSDQTATEFAELGHGLFTYVILEALGGMADGAPADNKVTVYELKSYLDDQVPEYSIKYKNTPQYPNTFSIGHDFPMVFKRP